MRPLVPTLVAFLFLVSCGSSETPESPEPSTAEPESAAASGPPRGQWYVAPDVAPSQRDRARHLESLGYASHGGEMPIARTGVLLHDAERAAAGARLYASGHGAESFLLAADGSVLHRWAFDPEGTIPNPHGRLMAFRRVLLTRAGVFLGIFEGQGLVALDADSKLLWARTESVHHDVREADDGSLYALDRRARPMPALHPERPFLDDGILFLSPEGEILGRVSLLDALLADEDVGAMLLDEFRKRVAEGLEREEQVLRENAEALAQQPELRAFLDLIGDLTHCNSVERIGPELAADGLPQGGYLVSCRELDAVFVVDVDPEHRSATLRHFLRGPWKKQHEASAVADGRILLFDNQGGAGVSARALELDAESGEVVWAWPGPNGTNGTNGTGAEAVLGEGPLRSPIGGTARRLPGGNTLIVESTRGRAFEVAPDGEVVWLFSSPHRAGPDDRFVAFLPQVGVLDALPPGPWRTEDR